MDGCASERQRVYYPDVLHHSRRCSKGGHPVEVVQTLNLACTLCILHVLQSLFVRQCVREQSIYFSPGIGKWVQLSFPHQGSAHVVGRVTLHAGAIVAEGLRLCRDQSYHLHASLCFGFGNRIRKVHTSHENRERERVSLPGESAVRKAPRNLAPAFPCSSTNILLDCLLTCPRQAAIRLAVAASRRAPVSHL